MFFDSALFLIALHPVCQESLLSLFPKYIQSQTPPDHYSYLSHNNLPFYLQQELSCQNINQIKLFHSKHYRRFSFYSAYEVLLMASEIPQDPAPTYLYHFFPLCFSFAHPSPVTLASLLFLKYSRSIPASGLLDQLFFLVGMINHKIYTQRSHSFSLVFAQISSSE